MAKAVYKVTFTAPKEDVKVSSNSVTLTGLAKDQAQGVSDALGHSRSASYTMDLSRKEAAEMDPELVSLGQSIRVFQAAVQRRQAIRLATEFGTPEALKQYLRDHPGADPSKHSVRPKGNEPTLRVKHAPNKEVSKTLEDLGSAIKDHVFVKKLKSRLEGDRPIPKHTVDHVVGVINSYLEYDETSKEDKTKLKQLKKKLTEYSGT